MIGVQFNNSVRAVKGHSKEFETTSMAKYGAFAIGIREVGKADCSRPRERIAYTMYFESNFARNDGRYVSAKICCLALLLNVETHSKFSGN
jgi:hypothetical protein